MADFNRKKLQVFVSSTFSDLIPERQAAVEAILTAGHIRQADGRLWPGTAKWRAGPEEEAQVCRRVGLGVNCIGGAQQGLEAYQGRELSCADSQKRARGIQAETQRPEPRGVIERKHIINVSDTGRYQPTRNHTNQFAPHSPPPSPTASRAKTVSLIRLRAHHNPRNFHCVTVRDFVAADRTISLPNTR
jgi:Domain of unknown function (DUF4062)